MLLQIPRYPRKTTVREISDRLAAQGFSTTARTIQRDLLELSGSLFLIEYDDRSKPYGWSWAKDSAPFYLPSLSISDAMVLQMIETHLRGLLPDSALDTLLPYFRAAETRIASTVGRKRHQWLDLVRIVPASQPLIPPEVSPAARAEVYEALLGGSQVRVTYQARGKTAVVAYDVNPLAIVQRGPITYLVATIFRYSDVRLLALHRVKSAKRLDRNAQRPAGFDLDDYLRSGHLDFGTGNEIKLHLRFFDGAGDHLHETALSTNQQITVSVKGALDVTATVAQTPQLTWWIRGFEGSVEVIKPATLRAEVLGKRAKSSSRYAASR